MRTLVVVRTLKVGGMERVAVSLADAFAAEGHDSHLLYFKERADSIAPTHTDVKVHRYDITSSIRKSLTGALVEAYARLYNILHSKAYFLIAGQRGGALFANKLKQLEQEFGKFDLIIFRGIGTFELIWTYHDDHALFVLENNISEPKMPSRLASRKLRALLNDKHLVTVSKGVENRIPDLAERHGVQYRSLKTITNPVPIQRIRRLMLEEDDRIPSTPFLLNVARLVPQKNHMLLLSAYAKAETSLPLYIVGAGKLSDELRDYANELGIGSSVNFVGQVENPYPWMKAATLFILSSKVEGLGIVLIEALACGTPVVSVDCPGGVRDIMKGPLEAYLCPSNADDLASLIDATLGSGGYGVDEEWLCEFEPQRVAHQFLQHCRNQNPAYGEEVKQ